MCTAVELFLRSPAMNFTRLIESLREPPRNLCVLRVKEAEALHRTDSVAASLAKRASAPVSSSSGCHPHETARRLNLRLTGILAIAAMVGSASLAAQEPGATAESRAIAYGGFWIHGLHTVPDTLRRRVAQDDALLDVYADVALSTRAIDGAWDTLTVVWWLAESGRPEFLPVFLRHGIVGNRAFSAAVYGLARHASHPSAKSQLLDVATRASGDEEIVLLAALIAVNDVDSRQVLSSLRARLSPLAQRDIQALLSRPALRSGEGRWPCPPTQVPGGEDTGPRRCVPKP